MQSLTDQEDYLLEQYLASIDVDNWASWDEIIHAVNRLSAYDEWMKMRIETLAIYGFGMERSLLRDSLKSAVDELPVSVETCMFNAILAAEDGLDPLRDILETAVGDQPIAPQMWMFDAILETEDALNTILSELDFSRAIPHG
jgi:hypothetical protein